MQGFDFFALVLDGSQQRIQLLVLDGFGELGIDAYDEVGEDVHVVGECLVGAVVRAETTFAHVLRAHVVEVVAALQVVPVLTDTARFAHVDACTDFANLAECFLLQDVTQPRAAILFFIDPRNRVGYRQCINRFHQLEDFRRRREADAAFGCIARQSLEELEDTGFSRVEGTENLVVHEQIDNLFRFRRLGNPVDVFVGCQRIFIPAVVREAVGEVFAEAVVLQQKMQVRLNSRSVHIVRTLPAEDMLGTFSQHTFVAHFVNDFRDIVGINQLRIAEDGRLDTEECLEFVFLFLNLVFELVHIAE